MHYEVEFFSQEKKWRNLTINYCVSNCRIQNNVEFFSQEKKMENLDNNLLCIKWLFSFHPRKDDIFNISTTQSDFSVNIWCIIIKKS